MSTNLASRFLAAIGPPAPTPSADLEGRLLALLAEARAAWPGVTVDLEGFFVFLGSRLGTGPDRLTALDRLRTADLYLAFACLSGAPGAPEAFSAAHGPAIRRSLGGVGADPSQAEDVLQAVYQKVFVPSPSRPPAIHKYDGVGGLRSWIRVTAVRMALNLRRERRRERPLSPEVLLTRPDGALGPEADYLKRLYSQAFKQAFEEALGTLSPQGRNLLRHHYIDGLTLEQIGRLHHVHKATISRRLATLREHLLNETRNALVRRLDVPHTELDSIMRLIQSRLDASICRYLVPP